MEELQAVLRNEREKGRAARREVESAHKLAMDGISKVGLSDLITMAQDYGAFPDAEAQANILQLSKSLPEVAPSPPALPEAWTVSAAKRDSALDAIGRLAAARKSEAAQSQAVLGLLRAALSQRDAQLDLLRAADVCPVCQGTGHLWASRAREQADRLEAAAKDLTTATKAAAAALRNLRGAFPPALTDGLRVTLRQAGDPTVDVRIEQWNRLALTAVDIVNDAPSGNLLAEALVESEELSAWYVGVGLTRFVVVCL